MNPEHPLTKMKIIFSKGNLSLPGILFFMVLLLLAIAGCTDQPCFEETDAPLVIGFYTNTGLQPADTTFDSLAVVATGGAYGFKYTNQKQIFQFLDPNNELTGFTFYFDTVYRVDYDSVPDQIQVDTNLVDTALAIKFWAYDSLSMEWVVRTTYKDTTLPVLDTTILGWEVFADSIYTNEVVDNVVLRYNPVPHLVSHDCGFAMYFTDINVESYTTNYIDTVVVTKGTVTNEPQETIQLHF